MGLPGTKAFYDAFELNPAINAPPVFAALPPNLTLSTRRSNLQWGPYFQPDLFDWVKTRTYQPWRKIHPRQFYCKNIENTFWHALSLALFRHEKFCAGVKAGAASYYVRTSQPGAGGVAHPRVPHYNALDASGQARGAAAAAAAPVHPVSTWQQQLAPHGAAPGGVVHRTSSELWQLVADAFDIELLVIIAQPMADGQKLIVPRGQHNKRQVFLLLETDGEYRAVEPASRDPFSFRFEWFKDVEHSVPPRFGAQAANWALAINDADEKRSPFTIVDNWERPVGVRPFMDGGVPVAAIAPAYVPPFGPPDAIVCDPISSTPVPAVIMAYLNTGNFP